MNTKNRNYRGAGFSLVETMLVIAIIGLLAAFAMPQSARASFVLLDGTTVTSNNVAYNAFLGGTGITNNYQNGQVPGASNVMYQLSTILNDQPSKGTNGFLPALVLSKAGGFPGSINGPGKNVSIEITGQLMATNATSTAVIIQFAGTDSGKVWKTNYATLDYTIPVNTTQLAGGIRLTNWDDGANGFLALQQINNPGVAAFTNITIRIQTVGGL